LCIFNHTNITIVSKSLISGFEGTYEEYVEYRDLHYIMDGEIPSEWRNRIWDRLMYFRNKKYYTYDEKDCFYARKASLHLIDGQKSIHFVKWLSVTYTMNLYILE
jgi:hypothetical protein